MSLSTLFLHQMASRSIGSVVPQQTTTTSRLRVPQRAAGWNLPDLRAALLGFAVANQLLQQLHGALSNHTAAAAATATAATAAACAASEVEGRKPGLVLEGQRRTA